MNRILKITFLIALFLTGIQANSSACTNFLITKGASKNGSTMITYAADSHLLFGELYFYPAANYKPGTMLDVYEWDTGKYLGQIPQVAHTYGVVGNMNEFQVSIAETTFGGRKELRDTTGLIDYGSLMWITLQRSKTAREAIKVMTDLVAQHGYYSSGESFSIADPNEVWMLEMIGKGSANKGALWVAYKIPDGYIAGHANQARIRQFPLNDPENCLYSDDVISFAKEKGWYEGKDKNFSFADTYAPLDFGALRFCDARVWAGFRKVNSKMDKFEDYAMGTNPNNVMPLFVKPDQKIGVRDVMEMMRDHYEGTPMDMTTDFGGQPHGNGVRWRPLTWKVEGKEYFHERAISTQQTGFSFVAQMRSWLPNEVGGVLWFGMDDSYSTVYTPLYCSMTRPPETYKVGNGSLMKFSETSAFWVYNQVSNFAYTRYDAMIPEIRALQKELELKSIASVEAMDLAAQSLLKTDRDLAIALLTDFSVNLADKTTMRWKELYHHLFTKYMDGNVKTPAKGQRDPNIEFPGYSKEWYKNLINNTGNKFLYPDESGH